MPPKERRAFGGGARAVAARGRVAGAGAPRRTVPAVGVGARRHQDLVPPVDLSGTYLEAPRHRYLGRPPGRQRSPEEGHMPRNVTYLPGSTQKVCQLTGECDRERNQFTLSRTASRFGVAGTDLGSNFEHNGRVYFLFGDTGPDAEDSIAYTEDTNPES